MRIYIPPEHIAKQRDIKLSTDKSRYLISVLRCRESDAVSVIDGKGRAYDAVIAAVSKKDVSIDIIREIPADAESPAHLVLYQGILKGEKMDMVVQKATELGAREIVPLITERCLVRETRKVKRWSAIAEEAAEQCGRAVIPPVHEPLEYRAALSAAHRDTMNGLLFWEEDGLKLAEAVCKVNPTKPIALFIGPEGGFSSEEVELAGESGLTRATLGKRILRAETAAIVSIALVQFLVEEKGGS